MRVLLRAAVAATLGAGLVGVARQRHESTLVRRRLADPAVPIPPPPRYGRLATSLATWVPTPPRTPFGRVVTAAWASPLTLAGLLVAVISGGRPRWSPEYGCFVTDEVRGASAFALRGVGAEANAIGQVVLSRHARSSPALLAHEAVHVRQAERLGPLLFPLYVWLSARYGYRYHPLEEAARRGARIATGRPV